ncbi:MutS-related protein [Pseudoflavitalea rhizosphaerae]|uniref:MutS-related protein n=1 Tax=Pseudoflavitalea rhizosphaerae TaxID=1884793 RepID=UPI000F8DA1C4|nr:DNA mismatch repair protein [Pseudoflavitalea rhizosphaerae]
MHFNTDKQTLEDLNMVGKPGRDSIYTIFNNTHTRGGAGILEQMFLHPLAEETLINNRSKTIQFFSRKQTAFPFNNAWLDSAELYLEMTDERTRLSRDKDNLGGKLKQLLAEDHHYRIIHNGVGAFLRILHTLHGFLQQPSIEAGITPWAATMEELSELLAGSELRVFMNEKPESKLNYASTAKYDDLLRFRNRNSLLRILYHIYHLDVFISVGRIAEKHGFVFPEALNRDLHTVQLEGVYHPLVKNAVPNTLSITPGSNIIFLTGANMAGKSTFMKSLGIAMFLAHMGFPVPAKKMSFSVRDGIYTTINLSDNLASGSSHFYAEVLRVKKVAQELSVAKNLFIIFDELFRGTNVKDAYEATIAITEAFAQKKNCMFIVSTHIVEAGDVLRERCSNIHFAYLPTTMKDGKPIYTYTLAEGVTADRHGMIIINNEGILDIINNRFTKTAAS